MITDTDKPTPPGAGEEPPASAAPPAAAAAPPAPKAAQSRVVRATRAGFYGGQRIREGVTFSIDPRDFTSLWMEGTTPGEKDELAARNHPRRQPSTAPVTTRRAQADLDARSHTAAKPGTAPKGKNVI